MQIFRLHPVCQSNKTVVKQHLKADMSLFTFFVMHSCFFHNSLAVSFECMKLSATKEKPKQPTGPFGMANGMQRKQKSNSHVLQ